MISFDLNFFPRPETRGPELEDFDNVLEWWLVFLLRNGNIVENWQLLEFDDRVQVRVVAMAPDALDQSNWEKAAGHEWTKIEALVGAPSEFIRIGNLPNEPTWCDCKKPSGRILFTTFLDRGSPVSCLDCEQDVPLYCLPYSKSWSDHNELRSWQADYQALDRLWMGCEVGERFAYRQLARPRSDFMKQTRQLASQLEDASGTPTYSYLLHYHKKWGKHCPLCKGKWKWKNSPRELLAYKCDHCRLVSSTASAEPTPLSQLHP